MDLYHLILHDSTHLGKEKTGRILGSDPVIFGKLYDLAFSRDMPVCWRAAWIMDHLAELEPSLAEGHIEEFWQEIFRDHPVGVVRSALRLLTRYDVPEAFEGRAADQCLSWLELESIPPALKAYSMDILLKLAMRYPELKNEIVAVIEEQAPLNSAGFKARATHVLRALKKL